MAKGSRRRRGNSIELRVYVGLDPATGRDRYATKTIPACSERDADRELRDFISSIEERTSRTAGKHTVAEAFEQRVSIAAAGWSPATLKTERDFFERYLRPHIGRVRVDKLTTEDIDLLYARLLTGGGQKGRPLAASTVTRTHGVLHSTLELARRWRWRTGNPADDASPPPVDSAEPVAPAIDDIDRLLRWIERTDPMFGLALRVDAVTGLRRAELCGLRWVAVDLVACELVVNRVIVVGREGADGTGREKVFERDRPKTRASRRRIAIDPGTVEMLRRHKTRMAEWSMVDGSPLRPTGYVFSLESDGSVPWRPPTVTARFRRARRAAGLGDTVRLHDLRHHVATSLINAGVDVRTVSGRIGHARTSTTLDIYTHGVPASDRAAAALLGDMLDRQRAVVDSEGRMGPSADRSSS